MRRPTCNDTTLARAFLLALALTGVYAAWCGTPPGALEALTCPFHATTGVPCPGCGMTRACAALARGDLATAWHHHPFSFALVALAAAVAFLPAKVRSGWRAIHPRVRTGILAGTIVLILGLWVHRLGTG
jgi:hypothetical protein